MAASTAGCLGRGRAGRTVPDNPSFPADDHDSHVAELTAEIERREVRVRDTEVRDDAVVVDYDSEDLNDDLAEVAMAFVERIAGGWGIERLDAIARDDSNYSWYAEAEWAHAYLDEEIDAAEYGNRISDTLQATLVVEDDEPGGE